MDSGIENQNTKPASFGKRAQSFLLLTVGALFCAIGAYFFKFPNNFATGGVNGVAVLVSALVPGLTTGTFVLITNCALLLIGFLVIGRDFGFKTVYCSSLMSVVIFFLERLLPLDAPLTGQPVLELVFAIAFPAVGSALLFNVDASTGGTDIIAMIIKKFAHINISKALFCADFMIVMATFFVFGVETWLFSLLGFLAKVFVVGTLMENINLSKYCTVITSPDQKDTIIDFIIRVLDKDATVSDAFTGAYTGDKKCVLFVALARKQAILLKHFVKELDPKNFVVVTGTSEIMGKGFHDTQ